MTLRQKLVIAFATVAVVVAGLVGGFTYGLTAHNLHIEVDRSLATAASTLSAPGTLPLVTAAAAAADQQVAAPTPAPFLQTARVIASDGSVSQLLGVDVGLPVSAADQSLATSAGAGTRLYEDVTVGDRSFRVLTQSLGNGGGAIQVARDLSETSRVLGTLAFTIAVVGLVVLLVAALAGALVARQITRRLTGLTEVAERVSSTGHLDVEIPAGGRDEVGRLSTSLQAMLAELARSRDDQHRLLQNAGHELRTPLTSLRTNVSVMRRFGELSPTSQRRLLDDVDGETRELTNLVNELVELATDRRDAEPLEPVDLAALAELTADRYRRRSDRTITVHAAPSVVPARPHAVERALSNLLDNAVKFDPDGQDPIEVRVHGATVEVLDPARVSTPRTSTGSSTASTARRRRGACPAPGSGCPSSRRWRPTTAAPSPRRPGPVVVRWSGSPSRRTVSYRNRNRSQRAASTPGEASGSAGSWKDLDERETPDDPDVDVRVDVRYEF